MIRVKFETKINNSLLYYYISICYFDVFNVGGNWFLLWKIMYSVLE